MKNKFLLLIIAVMASSCMKYNIVIPPPVDGSSVETVFPSEIKNSKGIVSANPTFSDGIEFVYPDVGSIWVYRGSSNEDALSYMNEEVSSVIQMMPSRSSISINGQLRLKGKQDGKIIYAWNNENWVFMIKSPNNRMFKKIVKEFAWIDKK